MTEPSRPKLRNASGPVLRAVALIVAFVLGAVLFGGDPAPSTADHAGHADEAAAVWTCSMHPQIRQPEPGQCPICGMDLIPADSSDGASAGTDRVILSDRARVLAQLRTTRVQRQSDASAEVRLLGRLEPDETTQRSVTTWIGGRIDRLHVNVTGERVRRGQAIASLYSPEVYGAHQDLITARRQVERLAASPEASRQAATAALRAARERLRLLGVPEAELDEMAEAESPTRSVTIRSPFGGTVIERVATEGAYVQTGAPLYRVADLGALWLQLDAYESDLPQLAVGQTAAIIVESLPGEPFEGRVAFIDPTVDPKRRTARVRVQVPNPEGRLRPGMFAEAVVAATGPVEGPAPLVVPASAPLFTGKRSIVYVETVVDDRPAYEPRTVRLGPKLGSVYPVVSGLSEGERVVTRGAFALDADLQIRGGPSMMSGPDDTTHEVDPLVPLTAAERDRLAPVLSAYLEVQTALAADDHPAAVAAAEQLDEAVVAVELGGAGAKPWTELSATLRGHARHVALSDDLEGAREGVEPLSLGIEKMLLRFGNPLDAPVHVAFCPMAHGSDGARWVQQGEEIDNVYFGAAMRRCGEIRAEIAPDTYLSPRSDAEQRAAAPAGHQH